jgi:hypothetical protein
MHHQFSFHRFRLSLLRADFAPKTQQRQSDTEARYRIMLRSLSAVTIRSMARSRIPFQASAPLL